MASELQSCVAGVESASPQHHAVDRALRGNAVKDFCSRIRENSDDPMTLQKPYDFCYVRLALFCHSEILNGVACWGRRSAAPSHAALVTPLTSPVDLISQVLIMTRLLSLLILTVVLCARVADAGVDLSQSKIITEAEAVRAGVPVTINVVLKNSGDKLAEGTDVRIRLPYTGFLVRIDELSELKQDDNDREVTARVNIPAGGEYRFSFDLLASRNEVGHHLTTYIEVAYLLDQVRWNSESSIRIRNAPSTAGIMIGGLIFEPAAGWLLGWVVCYGLLFVWLRTRLNWVQEHPKSNVLAADVRRMPPLGIASLVMVPLAFLMVLGGMAWRDVQTLTSWQEAQATILDRRESVQVSKAEWHKDGRRKPSGMTRTPEFALKYQAGEREVISSGFETGPSLHFGSQILGKAETDNWVAGKTIPCWYDPSDPGIVVVRRGFDAKYIVFGPFFGLLPLAMLWFGFRQLRKVSNAVRQLDEIESASGGPQLE